MKVDSVARLFSLAALGLILWIVQLLGVSGLQYNCNDQQSTYDDNPNNTIHLECGQTFRWAWWIVWFTFFVYVMMVLASKFTSINLTALLTMISVLNMILCNDMYNYFKTWDKDNVTEQFDHQVDYAKTLFAGCLMVSVLNLFMLSFSGATRVDKQEEQKAVGA